MEEWWERERRKLGLTSQGEIGTAVGTNGMIVRFADLGGTERADDLNLIPF